MKPKTLFCQFAVRDYNPVKSNTTMTGYHHVCDLQYNAAMLGVIVTRYADNVIIMEHVECFVDLPPNEQYSESRHLLPKNFRDFEAIRKGVEMFDSMLSVRQEMFPDLFSPDDPDKEGG